VTSRSPQESNREYKSVELCALALVALMECLRSARRYAMRTSMPAYERADPITKSSFAFVHNRVITPMVVDQILFVPLILPVRRAVAAAHTRGTHAVPAFGAPYPETDSTSRAERCALHADPTKTGQTRPSTARTPADIQPVCDPPAPRAVAQPFQFRPERWDPDAPHHRKAAPHEFLPFRRRGCRLSPSRNRRDTRLSKLCPGITVDAGP
jgi:hypothetical protein